MPCLLLPLLSFHLFSHRSQNDLLWNPPKASQLIPRKGNVFNRFTAWPCYLSAASSHFLAHLAPVCQTCQSQGLFLAIPSAWTTLSPDVSSAGFLTFFRPLFKSHLPNGPFLTTMSKVAIPITWCFLTPFSVSFSLMASNKVHIIFIYFLSLHWKVSSLLLTRFTQHLE